MDPPAPGPTEGKEGTELLLPLKVVAPAFLTHSRPKKTRKSYSLDESIPALFSGGTVAPAAPEAPVDEPLPQGAPAAAGEDSATAPSVLAPPIDFAPAIAPDPGPQAAPAPEPEAEAVVAAPVAASPAAVEAEPIPLESKTSVVPEPAPEAPAPELPVAILETPESAETPVALPQSSERSAEPMSFSPAPGIRSTRSLGEVLGEPERKHWSPPELVRATIQLEGVAGAIIALQEGLPVAAELPEQMKADTVAAFLPQIFARLTNYAGEMKLGAVEDILFTSAGSLFQIYRLGEVYFAVLGKPGEKLPWESLRLIAEELDGDHQK
jgi:predicted regulator of Ras-like GTPase activity (Roadblock/LC7/MglB family)